MNVLDRGYNMLSNNHICKLQSQKFALLQEEYLKTAISKVPCSLVMSLREMFVADWGMCYAFALEAYKCFANSHKCDSDDFTSCYEQIATYGVLLSNIVWGYDIEKDSMSLYTSSIQLLQQLASRGILVGNKEPIAIELEQLSKKLYSSDKIKKSIKDGKKIVAVRLDTEIKGKGMVMTFTLPRTLISLDTHVIVPFSGYQKLTELLYSELQGNILRVKMGDKVRDVTMNMGVLNSIYGAERAKVLTSYTPDMYTQRFYVPSVGASKYTAGVTNIKLTEVDEIKPISLADIDLTEANMDYSMVIDFFLQSVDKMTDNQIGKASQVFGLICLNAPIEDLRERLKDVVNTLYPREIWDLMKANPKLFKVEKYSKIKNKFGSNFTKINVPSTKEELQDLLSMGVYKILLTKRDGSFSTIIGSNNTDIIEKILGVSIWSMESDGVRLRRLKSLLSGGTVSDISALIKELKLENIISVDDTSKVIEQIDLQLYNIDLNKTVVKQPKLTLVRNLEARSQEQYYKYIDVNSIVEVFKFS